MTKNRYTRAFATGFIKKVVKLKKVIKILILRLLRIFLGSRRRRYLQSGFVLPTTVMVLLVVTLVVTTIIFRTFTRTSQVISERQQQVIYNSATPAIDRAKSKLEYLFRQDTRLPAGIPSDSTLQSMLEAPSSGTDTYTLPDETRLSNFKDANNNPGIGWYFTQNNKTIAYAIIFRKQAVNSSGTTVASVKDSASTKAPYLVVRNGPVNTTNSSTNSCGGAIQLASNEKDWEPITSASLAKTFQVTALVVDNANKANRAVSTLELQQDKQADKGNKWGAYFRGDIELFQGPSFRWNGAMHSDGSIFLGPYGNFKSYLISSPSSCVNTSANDSKVTAGQYTDSSGNITFQGQFIAGRLNRQDYGATTNFDLFNGTGIAPTENQPFTLSADSVKDSAQTSNTADYAVDPVALFTQGTFQARGTDKTNATNRDTNWITGTLYTKKRVFNEDATPPYLDDTYRADDRYGPNPTYDGKSISTSQLPIPTGKKVGDSITSTDANYSALTRNTPPDARSPEALGLDGYWERRAVTGGLRVIVGQRLELGNPLALPTNPVTPSGMGREHEFLQRRTQRDNLAAVQATAVYHYKSGSGTTPVACIATTVHPGTAKTLQWGATFETITFKRNVVTTNQTTGVTTTTASNYSPIISNFFMGRGTNGWEFSVPTSSTVLTKALNNLANFAGDPKGAFPPTQEAATGVMHPYSVMTQYGDFSNLRRSLSGSSIADQSYMDTASCMLGMLSYNISYLNAYDYNLNWDTTDSSVKLLDELNTALSSITASAPEDAINQLEGTSHNLANLARLVATKEQVKRDRLNGTGYTCDFTTVNSTATSLNILCPTANKYTALYYLFPTSNHAEDRSDSYITGSGVNPTSLTDRYQLISDTDLSTISTQPTLPASWNTPNFALTTTQINSIPGQPGSLPNSNQVGLNNLVKYIDATASQTYYQVAFKDAALFNGREMMSVRVLDLDLNLLKSTNAPGGDKWLPVNDTTATDPNAPPPNGIVYTFREDAVREDAIARPAGAAMNAKPSSLSDPTITSSLGISTKPVDYYPDPDRRPYGFRLKNGSSINRGTNSAGMSFISDNPVYVQGDLNLHSSDGTNASNKLLEEFTQKLDPTNWDNNSSPYTSFYQRTTRDTNFAQPSTDYWRPTEILADSFTILSSNACDGSIEDGIIYPGAYPSFNIANSYGCSTGANFTSYLNQNRPYFPITNNTVFGTNTAANSSSWVRENPYDATSPIIISQNGKPYYCTVSNSTTPCSSSNTKEYELLSTGDSSYSHSYLRFSDQDGACGVGSNRKCVASATQTRVNATIVQNIIPSRALQSYGGFHMFPRLNETWSGQNLFLSGAFIQLKFSTQATGTFDQDSWEPGQSAIDSEYTWYFLPPNRLWGYDVALQYQTAGPVSRRFTIPGNTRSEIYNELALDDPYILKLRCAKDKDGNKIDSIASCS
ncbi:hormogonium polysaccharide biosynthesis protein HpsA [Aetokthonos hydrillicola Thurmond2011]|uniref:Hormogonium polysaccharide biosynthesis protein HpsA n=1 Tax=Aetokthonos hydrillicola Thurmond2011 TaxID=2712845 RepID=A0AAP5M8V7_9CYAN|nr:hormogonium polysaccharide biosynthesis protein HpsA [Aetokthonos hydrillicola]MBO3459786.1 hypothetical protein [Aetokthonos hydrillicola CCALA 1050]MBW4584569.1 hormogonium polysaccharide biosynthesis protein HpsA [Aetokthonos hydrillicola CCALA 1050]MDR9895112.1 hormogonium polysaccharide biosynthesis protein HpsA [Aetokthonos hydrillicola Thurmond2011]